MYAFKKMEIRKLYLGTSCVKQKQGLSNAQSGCNLNSELCTEYPLFFVTRVSGNCFSRVENESKFQKHRLRIQSCLFF